MFLASFKSAFSAVVQILLLAALGFVLVKRKAINEEGLSTLSRLVVEVTLPLLIFCQLIKEFGFRLYPQWWAFPLLSIGITLAGLLVGFALSTFLKGSQYRRQCVSLIAFQNSGYLPLALIVALLPAEAADIMLVYLFLFLLGFNLLVWSLGVLILSAAPVRKFELGSLFSPPVIAIALSLIFVSLGLNTYVPQVIYRPLKMIGDCTLPLAMLVVGGNLAQLRLAHIDKKAVFLIILGKLFVLPALGLWLVLACKVSGLLGLLITMQVALPPATSLSLIVRHYKKDDLLISQGVFFGHLVSILTLPVFLSLYFTFTMIK